MSQILHSDWLPEQVRGYYSACSCKDSVLFPYNKSGLEINFLVQEAAGD